MPWLQVNMLEGRSDADIRTLMARLSEATADVLGVPVDTVRVVINEVAPEHWGVGGLPILEQRAQES